jgi:hypothetical protein
VEESGEQPSKAKHGSTRMSLAVKHDSGEKVNDTWYSKEQMRLTFTIIRLAKLSLFKRK